MARYAYDMHFPEWNGKPNLVHFASDSILTEIPPLSELTRRWGVAAAYQRLNSYIPIDFLTGDEDGALEEALCGKLPIPVDEAFEVARFLAPGSIFKGFTWMLEGCSDPNLEFDIRVVDAATGGVILEQTGLTTGQPVFSDGVMMQVPHIIKGGTALLGIVSFTKLPYDNGTDAVVDAAGNTVTPAVDPTEHFWCSECEPVPCIGLRVRFLTEDTCLAPRISGCGIVGDCCCDMPTEQICYP